ncbi:MAG: DUF2029 domain-containing protein [Bacteriovoracaceae bacterium]|jgi:hypothetical protein|nr:DUF2029 domain-containing protein [Bacteriovoracaceae bacterium]
MPFVIILAVYSVIMQITDTKTPVFRLSVLLIVGVYWYFKDRIDNSLLSYVNSEKTKKILMILVILLSVARVAQTIYRIGKPRGFMEDQAALMKNSTEALVKRGENFYTVYVDPYGVTMNDGTEKRFDGHKYTPLQNLIYGPWTLLFDLKGMYVGNIFSYVGIATTIFLILKSLSLVHGLFGLLIFLTTDFVYVLAFNNGTTDFYPTLFSLLSLASLQRGKENRAGILLGLSIACKQVPGAIFALYALIQKKYRVFLLASAVFWVVCLPFVIWDPQSFFRQIFEFPMVRPPGPLAMMYYLPEWGKLIFKIVGPLTISLAFLNRKDSTWLLQKGWALAAWGVYIFILFMKMSPTHYFVWTCPFIILWFLTPRKKAV